MVIENLKMKKMLGHHLAVSFPQMVRHHYIIKEIIEKTLDYMESVDGIDNIVAYRDNTVVYGRCPEQERDEIVKIIEKIGYK